VHFGRILVQDARDSTIGAWDRIVDGRSKAPADKALYRKRIKPLGPEAVALLKDMIPEIVDMTLHDVMFMFQHPTHHGIRISVTMPDGTTVPDLDAASDGLAGDLVAWIRAFSKERHKPFPAMEVGASANTSTQRRKRPRSSTKRTTSKKAAPSVGRPGSARKR
jgi:hypothetical protein